MFPLRRSIPRDLKEKIWMSIWYIRTWSYNLPNMLTTMSNRIYKNKKPVVKTISNNGVLSTVLLGPFEMSFYSSCKTLGIDCCEVSPYESSRCSNYIRNHRSRCDILGITSLDLLKILFQYACRKQVLV
jgi:hypothetical protein